jgi:hypothetical protein
MYCTACCASPSDMKPHHSTPISHDLKQENCCAGRGRGTSAARRTAYPILLQDRRGSAVPGVFFHPSTIDLSPSILHCIQPHSYHTSNVRMSRSRPAENSTMWIFVSTPRSRPIQPHGRPYSSNVLSWRRPSDYPTPHFGHLTSLLRASLPTTEL